MPIVPQDIAWSDGQDNDAGAFSVLYYAPISDIESFPSISDPSTFAEKATLTGSFTMKAGKAFKRVYGVLERGAVISEQVGERDGKSYRNTCRFSHPGNKAYMLGFMEYAKNTGLVMLVMEMNGQVRAFGTQDLPAQVDVSEAATGAVISDFKHVQVDIVSIGRIAPVYAGDIPLVSVDTFDETFDETFA